jgi:hypothetical protein
MPPFRTVSVRGMGIGSDGCVQPLSQVEDACHRSLRHVGYQEGRVLSQPPSPSHGEASGRPQHPVGRGPEVPHTPMSREATDAIMVLPYWPRRGWFPLLLWMQVVCPVQLPLIPRRLLDPRGQPHPVLGTLRCTAWRVSGESSRQLAFHTRLPRQWLKPCAHPHASSIGGRGVYSHMCGSLRG